MKTKSLLGMIVLALTLGGCASTPPAKQASTAPKGGGYYLDDGPEANPPANLDAVPDAVPRKEPLHPSANRTYVALGTRIRRRPRVNPIARKGWPRGMAVVSRARRPPRASPTTCPPRRRRIRPCRFRATRGSRRSIPGNRRWYAS